MASTAPSRFHQYVIDGRADEVEFQIKHVSQNPAEADEEGRTALMYAAKLKHLPVVQVLLKHLSKAAINVQVQFNCCFTVCWRWCDGA